MVDHLGQCTLRNHLIGRVLAEEEHIIDGANGFQEGRMVQD